MPITQDQIQIANPSGVAMGDGTTPVVVSGSIGLTGGAPDVTATGSLGALNATVQIALAGQRGAGMQLAAGTLIGTIVPEISFDGGTTWVATFFDDPTADNKVASIVFAANNTATARTIVGGGGASHVRIRVSAFTSGTATANLRASSVYDPSTLFTGAAAAALPPSIAQVGGTDGANLRAFLTDTSGRPMVVGAAAAGAAVAGNPVRIGASDGATTRDLIALNTLPTGFEYGLVTRPFSTDMHDAFGRLRVGAPTTIFDSKQISDNQPLFWDDQQISGASTTSTYNTNQASTTIAVANATAGVRARQTFRQFNYQPGKSQLIYMTFVFSSAPVAGIIRRVGQFNTNNGVFFEQNGATLYFTRRTFTSGSAVDNQVAQSSWNMDKLDGTGVSGITLDTTKTQILVVDYEWLGVGSIRFGFVLNGRIVYAHQINNANTLSLVWMGSPNLPLRYEIDNTGAGPAASLTHICSTVITEGGRDIKELGINFVADRGTNGLATNNDANLYPIIAMRLRSGYTHAQVIPTQLSIITSTNAGIYWQLVLNPTVTGTAFSYSTITNSAVEADVSRTNATTVSGGTVISSGYTNSGSPVSLQLQNDLTIGVNIAGTADVLVLAAASVPHTNITLFGSVVWHEAQ